MVSSVAFSPDGTRIVSGSTDRTAKVWDAATGKPVLELKGNAYGIGSVGFSADGTRIITASYDQTPKVWDATTGTPLLELKGHTDMAWCVAFSPDGTRIVTGGWDQTAKVWDAPPHAPPDAEELAYRRLHVQPDVRRYRERYLAARIAKDDFAAGFYLVRLPADQQQEARAEAETLAATPPDKMLFFAGGARVSRADVFAAGYLTLQPLVQKLLDAHADVDTKKTQLGPDNVDTLKSMHRLALVYDSLDQYDRSIPLLEETVKRFEETLGRDNVNTLAAVVNLGMSYKKVGQFKEAIPLLEEAHRAVKKYPELRFASGQLLDAYEKADEQAKIVALLQEQLADARKALPKDSPQLADILARIGRSFLTQKKWTEAEPPIREALAIREKAQPDGWQTFNSKAQLGAALLGQKKHAEAEPLLLAGYEGMKKREKTIPPAGKPRLKESVERLVQLYEETDKKDEAAKWRKELEALQAADNKPEKSP
jgi:tetratricopeptide (TPR) repeat protein